ncbi:hypothetical protein [Mycolicibacterium septicum]|uniref:hypothetical protein n=1 Tax=Mycolicibacterium septicum TaxID=98668 RepID=UPI001AFCA6FA|nr:hypothetical protein [Mycolicibacterium septicum]QRY53808.1 hypothetical protein JVX95_11065 [Mycolicibacterium septicum]
MGKSVIVVFPDALVDSGIADAVLEDLEREGVRTAFCHESADPFPARVLTTFGADPLRESESAEWNTIIGWDAWHGSWVVVPGWQHDDVGEIVDRWPAQLNACGLPVEDRPKLVIGVCLADLPRTKITHVDRNSIAVHWWWGVLDRLDTELRLMTTVGRALNPIDAAVIIEVSSWDLECTDYLSAEWDRTSTGLSEALRCFRSGTADTCHVPAVSGNRRGLTAPPAELEQPWRDGLVDRWGHGVRRAVHATDEADITQRLWTAHNRTLIQYVDEERADYEQMILTTASRASLDDLRPRDDDIIEIGSLAWLVDTRRVDIGKAHKERLQAFRDLRNDLAHRRPIGDELLRRIVGYLEF